MSSVVGSVRINVGLNTTGVNTGLAKMRADMLALSSTCKSLQDSINRTVKGAQEKVVEKSQRQIENAKKGLSSLVTAAKNAKAAISNAAESADLKPGEMLSQLGQTRMGFFNLGTAAKTAQNSITTSMKKSERSVAGLIAKVALLVGAFKSLAGVITISDDFSQTNARIEQMNDGLQTSDELVQMIYQSAQRARGTFDSMASVVGRFGNNARDAFESAKEVIDFSELIQKQMVIAGAGTEEAKNAMIQLSQAMGSGVLRGDELNSIFEQAPNLIRTIADYMDLSIGDVREIAAEGKITADIIKKAVFAAADDINEQFEKTPKTWGQAIVGFKNTAMMSFKPVLNALNNLANSDAFERMEAKITAGLDRIAASVSRVINAIAVIDVNNELNLQDDGLDDAAQGTAKYAKALGEVTNAAKTAKNNLAGFDELDVLQTGAESGSGFETTIAEAEKAAAAMADLNETVEKTGDVIEESLGQRAAAVINKVFAETDFQKGSKLMMQGLGVISDAVNDFSEAVKWKKIGQNFKNGLNGLFSPSDWGKAGKAGGKLVNGLFNTMYETAAGLDYNRLGEAIAALFISASESVDVSKLSGAIGNFITGYFQTIRTALSNPGAQEQLKETIVKFFTGLFAGVDPTVIGEAFGLLFHTGMSSLREIIGQMDPGVVVDGIKAMLGKMDVADIMTFLGLLLVTNGIPALFSVLASNAPGIFKMLAELIKPMLKGSIDDIGAATIGKLSTLVTGKLIPWITGTAAPAIAGAFGTVGSGLLAVLSSPITLIIGIIGGLLAMIVIFKDEFCWIFEQCGLAILDLINLFAMLGQSALNFISNIVDEIKSLKGLDFGWKFSDEKIVTTGGQDQWMRVPAYASGAVIRGGNPYLAIVGDQPYGQTNIETPMSTMLDAFRAALDEWNPKGGGGGTVILELDGRELARAELDYITEEATRRGISLA